MATWSSANIVLTTTGEQALAYAESGQGSLTITKVMTGSGRVDSSTLTSQTAIATPQQQVSIDDRIVSGNSSSLKLSFSNTSVTTEYLLNQIGIYATHPLIVGEFLYMIAQSDTPADTIPVYSGTPYNFYFDFYLVHTNATSVTLDITPSGAVPITRKVNGKALSADITIGPADIAQSASFRFVTDTEKTTWNNKQNALSGDVTSHYHTSDRYTHPATHSPSIIAQDSSNRFVTDAEKTAWNSKQSALSGDVTTHYHTADRYTHPATHAPSIIQQDSSNRFVTDTEKATWNGKQNALSGDVTTHYHLADRYTHPANHTPSIIQQDSSNRFVTDTEKTTWNGKVNITIGTVQPSSGWWFKEITV